MIYGIKKNEEHLAHYGVKGMKWGVIRAIGKESGRRLGIKYSGVVAGKQIGRAMSKNNRGWNNPNSRKNKKIDRKISKRVGELNSGYDRGNARQDYNSLGKRGVKRINWRMNKGQKYDRAYTTEIGRRITTGVLKNVGINMATSAAISALAVAGARYLNRNAPRLPHNPFFDPIDVDYKILK